MGKINQDLKNIIEAALLAAGQPLTLEKMLTLFPEDSRPTREEIKGVLKALEEEYADRGIELKHIDRSWRVQTRGKYSTYVGRLVEERPLRYSRALLETLAIIAYRQPVTRGEIEDIRGVSVSSETIKTLIGRGWVKEVGTKNVPGHPALLGTTRVFLEHFNIASLEELPPLSELRDLATISDELDRRAIDGQPDKTTEHLLEPQPKVARREGEDNGGLEAEAEAETAPALLGAPGADGE